MVEGRCEEGAARQQPRTTLFGKKSMSEMAYVTMRRGKGWVDLLRSYEIVIDGEVVATVRAGQTVTVPVVTGSHTLRVRIDWCGSEEIGFEVRAGEHIKFECGSNLNGWRVLIGFYYIFARRQEYVWLRRTS